MDELEKENAQREAEPLRRIQRAFISDVIIVESIEGDGINLPFYRATHVFLKDGTYIGEAPANYFLKQ